MKYVNVILTIILVVVLIAGGISIAMTARISKEVSVTGGDLESISKTVASIETTAYDISDTVDEISDQNGGSNPGYVFPDFGQGVDKPVIYLYPEEDATKTHVELVLKDCDMSCMWPEAECEGNIYSWDVEADHDGTVRDNDGNEYSYIFWEALSYGEQSFDKGFCVPGNETAQFLRAALSEIGLTPAEYNEFIVYWLPKMQDNEYNLISFAGLDPADDYNTRCRLTVTDENGKEADSVLRVMMNWKAVDGPADIEPQQFKTFERNGFTVVEWGGSEGR